MTKRIFHILTTLFVLGFLSLGPTWSAKKKKVPGIVGVGGGFSSLKFDSTHNGETLSAEGSLIVTELIMGAHKMAKTQGLGYRSAFSARVFIAPGLASDNATISGGLWSMGGAFTTLLTYNYNEIYGGLGQRVFLGLNPSAESSHITIRLDMPLVVGYRFGNFGLEAEGNLGILHYTGIGSFISAETFVIDKGATFRAIYFLPT